MTVEIAKEYGIAIGSALGGLAVGLKSMQVWFKRQDTLGAAAVAEKTLYDTLNKGLTDMSDRMDRAEKAEREREHEISELREKVASLTRVNAALMEEINNMRAELHQYRDSQAGGL